MGYDLGCPRPKPRMPRNLVIFRIGESQPDQLLTYLPRWNPGRGSGTRAPRYDDESTKVGISPHIPISNQRAWVRPGRGRTQNLKLISKEPFGVENTRFEKGITWITWMSRWK